MSTFKINAQANTGESPNKSDTIFQDQKICTCNSTCKEVLCEKKWWLNHHGVYPQDPIGLLEPNFMLLNNTYFDRNEKVNGKNLLIDEYCLPFSKTSAGLCLESQPNNCPSHAKENQDSWLQELESIADESLQKTWSSKDTEKTWLSNAYSMDLDSGDRFVSEPPKKHYSNLDSRSSEFNNIEPRWNLTENDAALFSAQRSSQFSNFVLPESQSFNIDKASTDRMKWYGLEKQQMENKKEKVFYVAPAPPKDVTGSYVANCRLDSSLGKLGLKGCILQGSDETFSSSDGSTAEKKYSSCTPEPTCLSKPQLLGALCYSQTRARQAEKLAQKTCSEKDHVTELFFRQASYLFAYRQWLRIQQLETLCLQLGSEHHPSVMSPILFPGICGKNSAMRKNRRLVAKRKSGKRMCYLCKYTVAFAVGLALAGAGLLVGWTVGWLFPAF